MAHQKLELVQIYKLRVTLQHIEPDIYRTLVVPSSFSLREFHELLQCAFGWENCHLHAFRDPKGVTYTSAQEGMFAMEMGEDDIDDASVQLKEVLRAKGGRLSYEYDFGDGWEHEVVLLEKGRPNGKELYPSVVDGARNCPPEDCGGPFGYAELVEIAQTKRRGGKLDEEDEERLEWFGDFDPEAFDLDEVNKRVVSRGKQS